MRGSWCGSVVFVVAGLLATPGPWGAINSVRGEEVEPLDDARITQSINQSFQRIWQQANLRPAAKASDAEWCRRAFVDVVGRIPTIAELSTFLNDSGDRRSKLVGRLLSDEYQLEYARYWANVYCNLLIGRPYTPRSQASAPQADRAAFYTYLVRCFAENKPYDRLMTELLTAEGSVSPGNSDFNPAANFLVDLLGNDGVPATIKTGSCFLGVRMQCFQCHNATSSDWKQSEFWELNSFFRQTRLVPAEGQRTNSLTRAASVMNADYVEGVADPRRAEVFFPLLCGQGQVAFPKMLRGPTGSTSGLLRDVNRREELARFIAQSTRFAHTHVDRTWGHFLRYGFSGFPVRYEDTLSCLGWFEELSHKLAAQFAVQGFDHRRLIRWIVLSEPYQLSSKMNSGNRADDPVLGVRPMFSRFYVRMLEPEQLYDSIETVRSQGQREALDWSQYLTQRNQVLANFTQALENDEGELITHSSGDPHQILELFNGRLTQRCVQFDDGSLLGRLTKHHTRPAELVDTLFLATYGRTPTTNEVKQLGQAIRSTHADEAYQDLLWALINSNEFVFVH